MVTKSTSLRDQGDEARTRRSWTEAAFFYKEHLTLSPADVDIWVQLGHALKEDGALVDAEMAYQSALSLRPDDAEIHLQLGHLMKVVGDVNRAASFYQASMNLQPSVDTYKELVALGHKRKAEELRSAEAEEGPVTYLQINDFLHFMRYNKVPSGIQRVQLAFIEYVLSEGARDHTRKIDFVFNLQDDVRVRRVEKTLLRGLLRQLTDVDVEQATLAASVLQIESESIEVRFHRSDIFVILGAFWGISGNTQLIASIKEQKVKVGLYVYDLIPLTHPEYCSHHLANDFRLDLSEALYLIDFVFAISKYSEQSVLSFIRDGGFPDLPVTTIPLAHNLTGAVGGSRSAQDEDWSGQISDLEGEEFVLCVCTIEPRKNHRYLFDIWKALIAEGVAVPRLVLVGRKGWHVEDFFSQLENSYHLDGRVLVVHDLSDRQLATLYKACLFTAFPSLVEGWGLPVGESLVYGKLCVSSSATSMPEVGGSLVRYIDPLNVREGLDVFAQLLNDRSVLATWEAKLRSEFRPRTWDEVCSDFFAEIDVVARTSSTEPRNPYGKLRSGELLQIGSLRRGLRLPPDFAYADLQRLVLGDYFYAIEPFGAWMKESAAIIEFATDLAPNTDVVVYIDFVVAPNLDEATISVSQSARPVKTTRITRNQNTCVRLKVKTSIDGAVSLRVRLHGSYDYDHHRPRRFAIGIASIAFAAEQDVVGRIDIMEQLTGRLMSL